MSKHIHIYKAQCNRCVALDKGVTNGLVNEIHLHHTVWNSEGTNLSFFKFSAKEGDYFSNP